MHLNYLECKCKTVKTYEVKKVKEVKNRSEMGGLLTLKVTLSPPVRPPVGNMEFI